MGSLINDIRYSLRLLRRTPAATIGIVGTLALAIGANAAIFALFDAAVLRPLPYVQPDGLVWITSVRPERPDAPFSLPEFLDYQRETRALSGMSAYGNWSANMTGEGEAERLQGIRISANAFQVLGAQAALGRLLEPRDDEASAAPVTVISYGLWQRRFGGQPNVVGRALRLNGEPYAVVGVLPRGLLLPLRGVDVMVPLAPPRHPWRDLRNSTNFLRVFGRLRPDASRAEAAQELTAICGALRQRFPREYARKLAVRVVDLKTAVVGDAAGLIRTLVWAVAIVLAIAGLNLTNVLLLRAIPRQREMAIRIAAGATTTRLARQILTEIGVLAAAGALAGLVIANWAIDLLVAAAPVDLPRIADAALNVRVVAFTLLTSAAVAAAIGIAPIAEARRRGGEALRTARGTIGTKRQQRVRAVLVTIEMACAVTLLVASAALLRSLATLQRVDPGFRPAGLFAARVSLPASRYTAPTQLSAFADRLTSMLQETPDATEIAAVSLAPFSGLIASIPFQTTDGSMRPDDWGEALFRIATPSYFETIGMHLVRGRFFTTHDTAAGRLVAIVNESLVARAGIQGDPIGRRIRVADTDDAPREAEIAGVVADTHEAALERSGGPMLFLPLQQIDSSGVVWLANNQFWIVRTRGNPDAFARMFKDALRRADPDAAASHARALDSYVAASLFARRFNTSLIVLFGASAAILATLGLYTIVSFAVRQRSAEMSVRLALGASPAAVARLVALNGLQPVAVGWIGGALMTVGANRLLAGMFFGTSMLDWRVLAATSALLFAVAAAAVLVPARRAAAIDPLTALRAE